MFIIRNIKLNPKRIYLVGGLVFTIAAFAGGNYEKANGDEGVQANRPLEKKSPMHFVYRNSLKEYPFKAGVTVRIFSSEGNTFSWTKIEKDSKSPNHAHPMEQTSILIEGELEATVDGETRRIKPGDAVLIPRGSKHEFTAIENSVIMEVFQPRLPQSALDAITQGQHSSK